MNNHLERNPQNGHNAVAARRRGDAVAAELMGCDWSTVGISVVKRSTFTKHHGSRPQEAPYG